MHNRAMFSPIRSPIRSAIRSAFDRRIGQPLWLTLVQNAESAAAAAGASLWYVPPTSYAAWAANGPFVNSDQSGGNPTVGSGLVGWLKDRGGSNNATQATTANKPVLVTAPGAAASALGFGAQSFDGSNDRLIAPITTLRYVMLAFKRRAISGTVHIGGTLNAAVTAGLYIESTGAGNFSAQDYGGGNPALVWPLDTNYHVAEIFLGASSVLKIDGVTVRNLGATTPSAGQNFTLGNSPPIYGTSANIDVVAFAASSSAVSTTNSSAIAKLGAYMAGITYTG